MGESLLNDAVALVLCSSIEEYSKLALAFQPSSGMTPNYVFWCHYRKDTVPLFHCFMYSLVSPLSGIYPFLAIHSLLVTIMLRDIENLPRKTNASIQTTSQPKKPSCQSKTPIKDSFSITKVFLLLLLKYLSPTHHLNSKEKSNFLLHNEM